MVKFNLTPRLNYNYSLKDVYVSLKSVIKDDLDFQKIYDLFRTTNIYFTNHARTGLRLLLNSLNLPENARIGVQAYNCHTVFQSIKQAGYQAIFIDIQKHLTISIDDLKNKNDSIDALIVTHIFGIPADFDRIKEIVKDKPIIEDCAHSFLSKYKGKLVGLLGDAAIFSFGKGKFPSIGSGGFVIINNEKLKPNFLRQYNNLKSTNLLKELKNIFKNFIISVIHRRPIYGLITYPIGKRIDEKIDVLGKSKFNESKFYKSNVGLLSNKWQKYPIYLQIQESNCSEIIKAIPKNFTSNLFFEFSLENKEWNFFMLPLLCRNREKTINYFFQNGIEVGKHFASSINWAKKFGYVDGTCSNSEEIVKKLIVIPLYHNLYDSIKLVRTYNLENL